jgi:hypothetical protein
VNIGRELRITGAGLATTLWTLAGRSLNLIGTRHPKALCDPFDRVSSGGCDRREFYQL